MPDNNDIYRDLLENLADGICFADLEGRITFWNKGAERLSGFNRSEVLGKRCNENILIHLDSCGRELCSSHCPLFATIRDGIVREADVFIHNKDGSRIPVRIRVVPLKDNSGVVKGAVQVFSDNTEKANLAEKLAQMEKLALLDILTGLPNRRYLEAQIASRLEELLRDGWIFGILFMDIDNFKTVNDRFGHDVGDRALKMVAGTLYANARAFDVVGRWGGDEFVAIIHNVANKSLEEIGERFRLLVEQSVLADDDCLRVTLSIGGTQACPGDTMDGVLNRADASLYESKKSGKNRVSIKNSAAVFSFSV
jgi:diguanylate cyclase (GGDEF)-like protein/PAS domain S-box-containing protein